MNDYEKWKFNRDTDVMVFSGEYSRIYLKKIPSSIDLTYWVVENRMDNTERLTLRDQDFNELRNLFKAIEQDPLILSDKLMELKRKR